MRAVEFIVEKGDPVRLVETWRAQFHLDNVFYAGSGATAWEAIAWALDEYQWRALLGMGPSTTRSGKPGDAWRRAREQLSEFSIPVVTGTAESIEFSIPVVVGPVVEFVHAVQVEPRKLQIGDVSRARRDLLPKYNGESDTGCNGSCFSSACTCRRSVDRVGSPALSPVSVTEVDPAAQAHPRDPRSAESAASRRARTRERLAKKGTRP